MFEAVRPFRAIEVRGEPELVECDVTPLREAIAGRYLGEQAGARFADSRLSRPGVLLRLVPDGPRTWDLSSMLEDVDTPTDAPTVPEAELRDAGVGLLPATEGWFVLNLRDMRWWDKPGQGYSVPLTGRDEYEAETFFPMLGMAVRIARPGDVTTTYHWETEQEDFLVLSGEGIAILEGEERQIRQWDFVHCPPGTRHAFVGTGDAPCVLLCASSRQLQKDGPWGFYCFDETADRHNAASPEDTQDGSIAYARFATPSETRYPDGLLPG